MSATDATSSHGLLSPPRRPNSAPQSSVASPALPFIPPRTPFPELVIFSPPPMLRFTPPPTPAPTKASGPKSIEQTFAYAPVAASTPAVTETPAPTSTYDLPSLPPSPAGSPQQPTRPLVFGFFDSENGKTTPVQPTAPPSTPEPVLSIPKATPTSKTPRSSPQPLVDTSEPSHYEDTAPPSPSDSDAPLIKAPSSASDKTARLQASPPLLTSLITGDTSYGTYDDHPRDDIHEDLIQQLTSTTLMPPPDVADEASFPDSIAELDTMDEALRDLRDAVALYGARWEEASARITNELESHKCPLPQADEEAVKTLVAEKEQLLAEQDQLRQRVLQQGRDAQALANRVLKAETDGREASATLAAYETQLARLKATLEEEREKHAQTQRDLEVSETHSEMLYKRSSTVSQRFVELEEQHEQLAAESGKLRMELGDNSGYILVVMEGEARMFDPQLLRRGFDGGYQFAEQIIREATRLAEMMALQKSPKILLYLYMDIQKTLDELLKVGQLPNIKLFDDFMEGFASTDDLINISDVTGHFGASVKIRAKVGMLGAQRACKLVLLIAGQDKHYINRITELGLKSKVWAARTTPNPAEDPFAALGDARLFYIASLFPSTQQEWARRLETVAVQQTGMSIAQVTQAPIQPNPALVPNPVVRPGWGVQRSDAAFGIGSPLAFSPAHTGAPTLRAVPTGMYSGHSISQALVDYQRQEPTGGQYPPPPALPHNYQAPTSPRPAHRSPPSQPSTYADKSLSLPPWKDVRAPRAPLPPIEEPATPPPAFRLGAYAPSLGGSPPSSLDEEPLLRHIPQAAKQFVVRPPRFEPEVTGGVNRDTGPPAGFKVNMATYDGAEDKVREWRARE